MATVHFRNALFQVNGTDLSNDVAEVTLNYSADSLDETAMGDDTRIRKGGLLDWSIDCTFNQDFAAGQVDATLFSLVGTTACVDVRPTNACATASNPSFNGVAILESYNPLGGAVGTLLQAPVRFVSASSLTRSVTT